MNQYLVMAAIVAAAIGWGGWQKMNAANAKLETKAIRASLEMAQSELQNAASVNRGALLAARNATAEAERQAKIAADRAAKERLAWIRLDKLKKEISSVPTTENVPVSNHLQAVLDAAANELRSAVPGPGPAADRPHEDGNGGTPASAGDAVPTEADPAAEAPGT